MKHRAPNHKRRRGVALIMVMMIVTVLAFLAGGFAMSMKVETKLARNASWDGELEWLGRSGIEVAKWVLSQKREPFDSLGQVWAGGNAETNEVAARYVNEWVDVGNGQYKVTIEDLDRRMNINSADVIILQQALTLINVDASQTSTIVNSILDWRDPDDNPSPGGAEKEFYLKLDPPYLPKNGLIEDMTELLLINGIRESPGIFWGSGSPPTHRQPKSARASHFEEPTHEVGFKDLFSAISRGPINVNTASAIALQVLPFISDRAAQMIIEHRTGPEGRNETPFRSPTEVIALLSAVEPQVAAQGAQFTRFLSVQSSAFEVKVQTRVGSVRRTYVAYLLRTGSQFQTLNLLWQDQ